MMAYENVNLNNAPFADLSFADPFEPNHIEDKLDSSAPGFFGQFNNNNNNNNNNMNTQQQLNTFANLQMQMNAQTNFLNSNSNNNSNNMMSNNCMNNAMNCSSNNGNNQNMQQAMMTNSFHPSSLMSSMIMQQPFFQPSFNTDQQQQSRGVPSFISFQNDASATDKPLPIAFEPKPIYSSVMEPLPMLEKSEPIKATSIVSAPRSVSKSKRLLPADFQPLGNYVICGNKRKYFESKGNIRFRQVCKVFLQEYVEAPTKIEKSAVVSKVMNILRDDCPEGAFISPQGGRWYAVSERTAREKVGTFFRDCLSDSYKSSAKNKIARRKVVKKTNSVNNSSNSETNFSDDNSLESISFYDVDDLTPVPL